MTIPAAPTIPDPSNQDTFNDGMYPFMSWMKDLGAILETVGNTPVLKIASQTLQYAGYDSNVSTGTSIVAGTTYYFPFFVKNTITITSIGAYTNAAGSGSVKFAIFEDVSGLPTNKLFSTTAVACGGATTQQRIIAISNTTLTAGKLYWFGINQQVGGSFYSSQYSNLITFASTGVLSTAVSAYGYQKAEASGSEFSSTVGLSVNTTVKAVMLTQGTYA